MSYLNYIVETEDGEFIRYSASRIECKKAIKTVGYTDDGWRLIRPAETSVVKFYNDDGLCLGEHKNLKTIKRWEVD